VINHILCGVASVVLAVGALVKKRKIFGQLRFYVYICSPFANLQKNT
jgi:hypothetical protein